MQRRRLVYLIGFVILLGVSIPALAQDNAACPALVELALSQMGDNCGGLGRNVACYGYNRVNATFTADFGPDFFSRPSDQSPLENLRVIRTEPLDLGLGQWGVAVLNVQANVPETLPGQAVTFLLVGDTEVENAVETTGTATNTTGTVQRIAVITQLDATLYSGPGTNTNAVSLTGPGTVLDASAISADGQWIEVQLISGPAWLERSAVNANPSIDSLPVQSESAMQSPMQSFYLRNTPGQGLACSQTPSLLAIQSPENIKVDLAANGANIRLGSLVVLQIVNGDTLKLTTLEGEAILEPDTPNAVSVPAGVTATRCLAPADNLGSDGSANDQPVSPDCGWIPRPVTPEEVAEYQIVGQALSRLGLSRTDSAPTSTAGNECPTGSTIIHTVSRGENLYRISLRYHTSMGAIMSANGMGNANLLYIGQQLTIPCGQDTGLPSVPPGGIVPTPVPGAVITPPTGTTQCGGFRATSPLDGLTYGTQTFYWDPAPGVTSYQVNIYNYDEAGGARVGTFFAEGVTSLTADLSIESIGYGFSFGWEVLALVNGQVACSSGPFNVPRAAAPASPQQPGITFNASWACGMTGGEAIVNYANLPASETSVTVMVFDDVSMTWLTNTSVLPPYSGATVFLGVTAVSNGKVIANPSGATVILSPASLSC
ncbi:MAG: LysM peptidoglycan-binding domain-containing protein [Anaerolineae bacterium]|nr:LysM peptidoglycan-binding domain-containing protein [Anaerolineae bacterium]